MTEAERELRLSIEQRFDNINSFLDRCIEDVQQSREMLRASRMRLEAAFMWHPFPKTEPPTYGNHLCTYKCGKSVEGVVRYRVHLLDWQKGNWWTSNPDGIPTKMTDDVTAWMSLPMPYEWGRKEY